MDDIKIVQLLKEGKRSKAFLKLYQGYPMVEKLILSKGGTKEDAKDIFQESLIIFYQKASKANFELTSKISTYLYSICRFLWKDELKKRNRNETIDFEVGLESEELSDLSELIDQEQKYKLVEEVLLQIGDRCLKLLVLFYYQHLSMKNIANELELKSEKVAKNQKYKCIERAKLKLKEMQSNPTIIQS